MRVLATLALLAAALAALPPAQATEVPPPCQTMSGSCCGIEPSFAPCCSLLSCPPPAPRCPETRIATSDFLAYLGPHASVATHSDCSVTVCNDLTANCCTLDGAASACGSLAACEPVPPLMAAVAIPLPRVGYTVNPDCSVTVTETYGCPSGFWTVQAHYDAGPADVWADYCAPMCACMPIEVDAVPEALA